MLAGIIQFEGKPILKCIKCIMEKVVYGSVEPREKQQQNLHYTLHSEMCISESPT